MLTFEGKFPAPILKLLKPEVYQHIMGIVEASPTSKFYYHVKKELPNIYVYLIENNVLEPYTVCHYFLTDVLGAEYLYQSLPLEEIRFFSTNASKIHTI